MRSVFAFAVFLATPVIATSQELASLQSGDNIRVVAGSHGPDRVEGTLLYLTADSARFRRTNSARQTVDTISLAMADLESLDVRRRTGGASDWIPIPLPPRTGQPRADQAVLSRINTNPDSR